MSVIPDNEKNHSTTLSAPCLVLELALQMEAAQAKIVED